MKVQKQEKILLVKLYKHTNTGIALNTAQTISSIAQQIVTQKYCESLDFTL
jgi:hypothetical protein